MGMRKKTIHKKFCQAGLVLALAGTLGTYGATALAEDKEKAQDESQEVIAVNVENDNKKIELRDQTFTLGRMKLNKGTEYDYRETAPTSGIVGELLTENKVENPLGEDYEGYVEVKGRIKSGDTVWLEISLGGKPAGYISQGRLEVKPITRTKNVGLPEGLNTNQVAVKDTTMYTNLTFLDTKEEVLPENTEITILGVYDVTFYNNPVESVQVKTSDGLTGWVKPTDITIAEVEDADKVADSKKEDTKEEDKTEKAKAKVGTVLYTQPTYLEDTEVSGTLFSETDVEVVDRVEDTGVTGTYFKVFTKDGKEGYIEVNESKDEVVRTIVSTEKVDLSMGMREPNVLLSKPTGVSGSRDIGMVGVDAVLKATEKVTTEDGEGKKDIFYRLTDAEGDFVGYAHEQEVIDLNSDEAKEATKAKESGEEDKESEDKEGSISIDGLNLDGLDLAGLGVDAGGKDKKEVKVEDLKGWAIAENPNPTKVNSYNDYVTPGSISESSATVNFIKMLAPYSNQVREGGLYPSVMMAQAILESDSGQSGLARNSLNLFGIKGSYNGKSTHYNTQEASGAQFYGVRAGFRDYPTLEAGIADYVKLLNNSNYTSHGAVNAPSSFHSLTALKSAGYATDPLYVPKVWNVIDSYDLTQFD